MPERKRFFQLTSSLMDVKKNICMTVVMEIQVVVFWTIFLSKKCPEYAVAMASTMKVNSKITPTSPAHPLRPPASPPRPGPPRPPPAHSPRLLAGYSRFGSFRLSQEFCGKWCKGRWEINFDRKFARSLLQNIQINLICLRAIFIWNSFFLVQGI